MAALHSKLSEIKIVCGQNFGVSVVNCQIHQGFVPYGIQCVSLRTSLYDYSPNNNNNVTTYNNNNVTNTLQ